MCICICIWWAVFVFAFDQIFVIVFVFVFETRKKLYLYLYLIKRIWPQPCLWFHALMHQSCRGYTWTHLPVCLSSYLFVHQCEACTVQAERFSHVMIFHLNLYLRCHLAMTLIQILLKFCIFLLSPLCTVFSSRWILSIFGTKWCTPLWRHMRNSSYS